MSFQHFRLDGLGVGAGDGHAQLIRDLGPSSAPLSTHPPVPAVHIHPADPSCPSVPDMHHQTPDTTAPSSHIRDTSVPYMPDSHAQTIDQTPPSPQFAPKEGFYSQQPTFQVQLARSNSDQNLDRTPYGSGDADDGFTLEFTSLEEFQKWRSQEEATNVVEFVKGDTHGSKAVPPRFKDHTKLVCARHSRSGRKYVKKYPERNRKVPSRKIEGEGCPASISYKTYYGTPVVRAMYQSQHSHPTGIANLPYTRRGRKMAEKERKLQQQEAFCRANPVLNGTAITTAIAQLDSATLLTVSASPSSDAACAVSKNAMHVSPHESPVMGSLQPPPEHEEDVTFGAEHSQPSYVQEPPYQDTSHQQHQHSQPMAISTEISYDPSYSSPTSRNLGSYHMLGRATHSQSLSVSPHSGSAQSPRSAGSSSHVQSVATSPIHYNFQSSPVHVHHHHQQQYLVSPDNSSPFERSPIIHAKISPNIRHEETPSARSQNLYSPSFTHLQPQPQADTAYTSHPSPLTIAPTYETQQHLPLTPHSQSSPVETQPHTEQQAEYHHAQELVNHQDRWERLNTLFQSIRLHARTYAFPAPSIAALESVLLRLYLEGPLNLSRSGPGAEQQEQPQLNQMLSPADEMAQIHARPMHPSLSGSDVNGVVDMANNMMDEFQTPVDGVHGPS